MKRGLYVEVTPNGEGYLMRGDEVLADFEDPRLARALLAVARAAKNHSHAEVEPVEEGEEESCPICRALSRLASASGGRGSKT